MSLTRDDFETGTCRGCGRNNYQHHEPCYYSEQSKPYQVRATKWIVDTFGQESADDIKERNDRFAEESAELLQACGYTESELHQMIAHVFSKKKGDIHQEIGGVIHTLSGLCSGRNIDMMQCAEDELKRVEPLKEKILAKGINKPRFSPISLDLTKLRETNPRFVDLFAKLVEFEISSTSTIREAATFAITAVVTACKNGLLKLPS